MISLRFNQFHTCIISKVHYLQIVLPKGYIAEDFFRYSADPTVQKVWKKRIEPYMEDENYPTVCFENTIMQDVVYNITYQVYIIL